MFSYKETGKVIKKYNKELMHKVREVIKRVKTQIYTIKTVG